MRVCKLIANHSSIHYSIDSRKFYYSADAYCKSKLAQVLFTFHLNHLLEEKNIDVQTNCVHPGIVNTDIFENSMASYFPWITNVLFKTPEQGARTVVYAAISPDIECHGGSYLSNCSKSSHHESADDLKERKKLFDYTCDLLDINNFGSIRL